MWTKEMKKPGRVCGRRCLGPMKFHPVVEGNAGRLASSDTTSRTDRLVFVCRPVKINEKVRIRIESGHLSQDGHKAVRIGFTNAPPLSATPGLRDVPESCVVPLPEDLCLPGAQIEFWINYACFVIIRARDRKKYYMKAEGLNLHEPVFVFFDVCGSVSSVRLLGSRKGDRTSCPSGLSDAIGSEEQALNDNLLNVRLLADANANSDQTVFSDAPAWQASHSWPHTCAPVSTQRSSPSAHRQAAGGLKRRHLFSVGHTDLASLLRTFQLQYLSSSEVHVIVRRTSLLKSALDALSNRNFSWTKNPYIEFEGEEAFDNGGPRREFFRLLMIEVQSSLGIFEGSPNHLFFTYDQIALQQRKYEQAGKLVAWSIVHGGPGFKALDPHLYQLMCGVQTDLADLDWRLIPDADVQRKAQKILSCTTAEHLCALQRELGDWISDCGFPGIYGPNIGIHDVPKIYSYVVRHYIYLRVSNMIKQFIEGLNSCGKLWDVATANWIDFLPIFTKTNKLISRSSFRSLFEINWSAEGTKRREKEEETIYCWELVLKMIEEREAELRFEELLVFITASDEVPVFGFPEKASIHFYQPESRGCRLPYASTCMMGLFLPRGVTSQAELNHMLLRAVRDSGGFGKS